MKTNSKKLAPAGVLCAVAVVGSMLQFPVFGSQCAPVQHMVNVICAVFLGPGYGVAVAFLASLLRNIFGLGSLLAFPGSMCGALLCGVFAAVEPDAAAAAALASAFWKICARRAEHLAADRGSGSFRTALLDAANTLTASDAAREAEILTL